MNTKKSFRQTNHKVHRTVPTFFIFLLITTGCLTVAANITNAATYYLDAINGNDTTGDGNSSLPWKTLAKAQSIVVSGDTVIVRDGSYSSYSENDIVRTDWVTYKAAVGHTPVLSGISITQTNLNNSYLIFDGLKITTTGTGIQPTKVRYLQLLNLTIEGSRDTMAYNLNDYPAIKVWIGCQDVNITNCTIKSSTVPFGRFGFTTGIYIHDVNNVTVTNCDISGSGKAIYAQGNSINIVGCNLHNLNSDGIIVDADSNNVLIQNNAIHDIFIYEPCLAETPTDTTWSADGKTMFNSNAKWATAGDNLITTNMEVYVKSGTNVYLNDGESSTVGNFTISSVDANGMSMTISHGISDGNQPSNVDYFIRASFHADNIQVQANVGKNDYNVTISKNYLYDNRGINIDDIVGGGQLMHIWPSNTSGPNGIGAYNILVENNLIWSDCNSYSASEEYYRTVNLRSTDGLIFRNNTVIGRLAIGWTDNAKTNKNAQCYGNIISYIDIFANAGLINNNYNIMNRGIITSPFSAGANDTFFHPNVYATANWHDPNYTGIFNNFDINDFNLMASSLAVGHGDPNNYPLTDINGTPRIFGLPDAGCYEYKPVYFPLSITKCTVTAGSKTVGGNVINSDRISISGDMNAVADDFNDTNAFKVTVDSNYIVSPCVQTFTVINGKTFKNSKYSYSGTDGNGVRKSFSYNPKTQKFSFSANSVDLSGLDCLVNTKIEIGDFNAMGDANETIVNGAKTPIPIKLMTGVKNVLRVDKCTVKHGKKPASDILSARGAFAVEDTDANMTDRISDDLVVTLDTQQFTIPANKLKAGRGYFTCSRADVNEGGIHAGTAAATFNFNLCSFILTIKKDANIPPVSGDVDFSVSFTDFNEVDRITFL